MGGEMVRDEGVVECESAKQSQTKCVSAGRSLFRKQAESSGWAFADPLPPAPLPQGEKGAS